MDFKNLIILLVVIVILFLKDSHGAEGSINLSKEEDLEIEKQLKILNKPPIKTIQTKSGDIYDCIDIYKQPAFDHPLLKNHKIELQPEFILDERIKVPSNAKVPKFELELHSEKCPSGTVPIMRTKKEDLVNAKKLIKGIKSYHTASKYPIKPSVSYHSVSLELVQNEAYHGAFAMISVHKPEVTADQFSTAQIWVQNGPLYELNSIEFGWAVAPSYSLDTVTRVFASWTADGYNNTGCFNMDCTGFVQVRGNITLGSVLDQISIYGGVQYLVPFVLGRSLKGNWWFGVGLEGFVGYWPSELFTHLKEEASVIKYGGMAGTDYNRSYPPMGNGHLPDKDYSKACNFIKMKVVDPEQNWIDFDPAIIQIKKDVPPDCYDLVFNGYDQGNELAMLLGGPGGRC